MTTLEAEVRCFKCNHQWTQKYTLLAGRMAVVDKCERCEEWLSSGIVGLTVCSYCSGSEEEIRGGEPMPCRHCQ